MPESSSSSSSAVAAPAAPAGCSLGNAHEIRLTHLDWRLTVDFDASVFRGVATYTLEHLRGGNASTQATRLLLQLDTSHLIIESVRDADTQRALPYRLDAEHPHLGRRLEISLLPKNNYTNNTKGEATKLPKVAIAYATTPAASAIQWLPPTQTAGKRHPYLFTQCQAIHARSMVPCHDEPGAKMTWEAHVTVPAWAVCVMSGLHVSTTGSNTSDDNDDDDATRVWHWQQTVPVSSYLIAMAVGDLAKRDISHRCAVWSEPALVEPAAHEFAQSEDFLQIAEQLAGLPYAWGRYDLLCLPPSFPYGGMENPCLTFVTPTLLARDRSLADVVAHEIAHSWTGNLVTNSTWDHFWLNEGWTTWFQRKIMARIHQDDKFLDFDAIGGLRTLQRTMDVMPPKYQSLVLPMGDQDPDDAYSSVAYEKGFNLLYSLEKRVGKDAFEAFFQAYVQAFASQTLDSEQFKDFFLQHFQGNPAVEGVDWDAWFYQPGMPPEQPVFDRTLSEASEQLAQAWWAVDRKGAAPPSTDISGWSSGQITCFLDSLLAEGTPLQRSTLKVMDDRYQFSQSQNAEILFRFCQISIAAEDTTMLMIIVYFITTQGRMKYVRPLYRALYQSAMGRDLAVDAFLKNADFYHPICAKMVATDLCVELTPKETTPTTKSPQRTSGWWWWAVAVGAVAVASGVVLARRKRN